MKTGYIILLLRYRTCMQIKMDFSKARENIATSLMELMERAG